jgi:hypothetical protein
MVRHQQDINPRDEDAFDRADELARSSFPRTVRTLRFLNPGQPRIRDMNGERASKSKPETTANRTDVSAGRSAYRGEGIASWSGPDFHGGRTANGERYDMHGISAAHRRVEFVGRAPKDGSDDQMLLATLRTGAPAPAPAQLIAGAPTPSLASASSGRELRSE